jgi:predicted ATPase/DNA-binding winged helix-turn-helix (wHTH) protein
MPTLHYENFEIHLDERRLVLAGQEMEMGARAFDVLVTLAQHLGSVVSKAELMQKAWPHVVVEENNLQVQIHALRKLLGSSVIATVPGRGYRLTAKQVQTTVTLAQQNGQRESGKIKRTEIESTLGNFPAEIASIFGRQNEIEQLKTLIASQRLITITGGGGRGKSSLAQHIAWLLRANFEHGVWFIDLSSVNDSVSLIDFVAQTIGANLPGLRDSCDELVDALNSQNALLLFDGAEHVVKAVGALIQRLLHQATELCILVTSQERLRIQFEQVYTLAALPTPKKSQWQEAMTFGAVRLLCERVQALDRRIVWEQESLQSAIEICERLDGNALAIELAAARIPILGVQGVLEKLSERLELLSTDGLQAIPRHVSLLSALDWSYQLLSQDEASLFRQLGVFKDGFSLRACQIYLRTPDVDDWTVMDLLNSLIERSLVVVQGDEPPRFRLLETNRTYALHRLELMHETQECNRRHAQAMNQLCDELIKSRNDQLLWLEMNNVRTAFDWAVSQSDESSQELAVSLACASAMLLAVGGQVTEALSRLLQVQPWVNEKTPIHLAARYWQWLARCGGRGRLPTSQCIEYFERAEQLFEKLTQTRHIHACRRMRAEALLEIQDIVGAQNALALAQAQETPGWPIADRLRRLRIQSLIECAKTNYSNALANAEFALSLAVADGVERYVVILQAHIAGIHAVTQNHAEAIALYQALLANTKSQYFQKLTLASICGGLMVAQIASSQPEAAAKVCLERLSMLRRSSLFMSYCDVFAWLLVSLDQPLPAARFIGAAQMFYTQAQLRRDPLVQRAQDATLAALSTHASQVQVNLWRDDGVTATENELAAQLLSLLPTIS